MALAMQLVSDGRADTVAADESRAVDHTGTVGRGERGRDPLRILRRMLESPARGHRFRTEPLPYGCEQNLLQDPPVQGDLGPGVACEPSPGFRMDMLAVAVEEDVLANRDPGLA
jgi:hypothetical protein